MNTFVRREILDNSISGDKIFGGDINWVDGLYTDGLVVPHDAGSGGVGSIDGSAFAIGVTDRILLVDSTSILGGGFSLWSDDYSFYTAVIKNSSLSNGNIVLSNIAGTSISLNANLSAYSYHVPKFIIGSKTEYSNTYDFEVANGRLSFLYSINGTFANITTAHFSDLWFEDHLSTLVSMKAYSELVDYLATNALAGGVGPLLVSPLQEIVDNITAWQMSMVGNIEDTILNTHWEHLSNMNQSVAIGQNVTFGDVDVADVSATGNVVADGNSEGDKLIETSGGMSLVTSQHRDIRGLHLDWHHPLGTSSDIRIIIEEGECIDASKSVRISLTSKMTKRINDSWAVGDGNGGRAGALTSSTYYWVHVIYNSAGSLVDAGFDTSITATNLLSSSGYTHYRTVGRVYVGSIDTIVFFEDIALYYYTSRPVRSGFKLVVSSTYVDIPFTVFAGAERLGKFATIWIQEGSEDSANTYLKYIFGTPRPTSIDGLSASSSAPCNFLSGDSGDRVRAGEIILSHSSDEFICKVFNLSFGEIKEDNFVSTDKKGLREHTAFTLYLYENT